ncbi:MAG TPA: cobalamin biosynthesis protein P47K, partial [Planctomycetaceae bacterium]|nr:cobalamin biosynthesis protein P47K [Planctomycetaceae bacterium]
EGLKLALIEREAEPAHLKTIGLWEGFFSVANLISSDTTPELSLASNQQVKDFDLIVNARVACDPVLLEEAVDRVLEEVCQSRNARVENPQTQSFRPGRPVPTHRFAE